VSEWVSKWVSEWVSKWVSEWVSEWVSLRSLRPSELSLRDLLQSTRASSATFMEISLRTLLYEWVSECDWVECEWVWLRDWLIDWLSEWVARLSRRLAWEPYEWVSVIQLRVSEWLSECDWGICCNPLVRVVRLSWRLAWEPYASVSEWVSECDWGIEWEIEWVIDWGICCNPLVRVARLSWRLAWEPYEWVSECDWWVNEWVIFMEISLRTLWVSVIECDWWLMSELVLLSWVWLMSEWAVSDWVIVRLSVMSEWLIDWVSSATFMEISLRTLWVSECDWVDCDWWVSECVCA
jgi:hypothetical protein